MLAATQTASGLLNAWGGTIAPSVGLITAATSARIFWRRFHHKSNDAANAYTIEMAI
jgi:hypothetical protein